MKGRPPKKLPTHDAICRQLWHIVRDIRQRGKPAETEWKPTLRVLTDLLVKVPLRPDERKNVIRRLGLMKAGYHRITDRRFMLINLCRDSLVDEQRLLTR